MSVQGPHDNQQVEDGVPFEVSGIALGLGGAEPRVVDTVTVAADGGAPVDAKTEVVPRQSVPTVRFTADVAVSGAGGHLIRVTAVDDVGSSATDDVVVQVAPPVVTLPGWNRTARIATEEIFSLEANASQCASIYLDTQERHSNDSWIPPWGDEGEDHHQGIARTHRLSDGSVFFFLSHSERDSGDKGISCSSPTPGRWTAST